MKIVKNCEQNMNDQNEEKTNENNKLGSSFCLILSSPK